MLTTLLIDPIVSDPAAAGAVHKIIQHDTSWLKALLMVLVHIRATYNRPLIKKYAPQISSFSGGLAVTYIFGHLLPEVNEGHHNAGDLIYLVTLLGFLVYFWLERFLKKRNPHESEGHHQSMAWLSIGGFSLYNFLIIFGMRDSYSVSTLHVVFMSIAVGLHIMVTDYDLGTEYPKIFDKRGRFLLASAALFGLMFRYWRPDGEFIPRYLYGLLGRINNLPGI